VTLNTSAVAGNFAGKDVANGVTVTATGLAIGGAQASNYLLAAPTTTANITPATLGLTGLNKVYDATTQAPLANLALVGVFPGDAVTLTTSSPTGTFTSKDVGNGIAVMVSGLTLTGSQAGDYTVKAAATGNITPATLTVSGITAANKVYDATSKATLNVGAANLAGLFAGDSVTLSTAGATGTFAGKDVGNDITVTVSGATITGAQAADYQLSQPTTTANITPASLTASGVTLPIIKATTRPPRRRSTTLPRRSWAFSAVMS